MGIADKKQRHRAKREANDGALAGAIRSVRSSGCPGTPGLTLPEASPDAIVKLQPKMMEEMADQIAPSVVPDFELGLEQALGFVEAFPKAVPQLLEQIDFDAL